MPSRPLLAAALALLSGCAVPSIVRTVHENSPAEELGRPGWIRGVGAGGAWIGGGIGTIVSIVALPVTVPLAIASGDAIGADRDSLILMPVGIGAGFGEMLFAGPLDLADWGLRRAWTEQRPTAAAYTIVEQPPPRGAEGTAPEPMRAPPEGLRPAPAEAPKPGPADGGEDPRE